MENIFIFIYIFIKNIEKLNKYWIEINVCEKRLIYV